MNKCGWVLFAASVILFQMFVIIIDRSNVSDVNGIYSIDGVVVSKYVDGEWVVQDNMTYIDPQPEPFKIAIVDKSKGFDKAFELPADVLLGNLEPVCTNWFDGEFELSSTDIAWGYHNPYPFRGKRTDY